MLEALNCTYEDFLDSDIIDPTSGSGNLLAAALIIGADPHRVFGNEYDPIMVIECRKRLQRINPKVRSWQIHQGDATDSDCLKFSSTYKYPKFEQINLF
jgi:predicted RNA methylase